MPRAIRYVAPEGRPEPRKQWLRFRVNPDERAHVERLAAEAGLRVSDYLRALVNLPALSPGAPLGNQNKRGTPGGNVHTASRR
jgi:hypothetical protein